MMFVLHWLFLFVVTFNIALSNLVFNYEMYKKKTLFLRRKFQQLIVCHIATRWWSKSANVGKMPSNDKYSFLSIFEKEFFRKWRFNFWNFVSIRTLFILLLIYKIHIWTIKDWQVINQIKHPNFNWNENLVVFKILFLERF